MSEKQHLFFLYIPRKDCSADFDLFVSAPTLNHALVLWRQWAEDASGTDDLDSLISPHARLHIAEVPAPGEVSQAHDWGRIRRYNVDVPKKIGPRCFRSENQSR